MKSTATANPVMTGHAVKFMQSLAGFVATALFPIFPTAQQSEDYYVFDEENMLSVPTNIGRAPGTGYSRSKLKISGDKYSCKEYGHEEPVDDRERAKYADAIQADVAAVERLTNILRINHELRVKTLATSGSVPSAVPAIKWDAANSTPVKDVDAGKTNIHKNTGMEANVMVVNRDVFLILKEHATVLDKIKYSQRGVVTEEILAQVFGVQRFIVAGGIVNGAAEGQALSPSYIWGDSVILAHVNPAVNLKAPTFGRTFAWSGQTGPSGILVESYREDKIRSDVHRARQDTDEKIVGAKCAYHLSDVLT